MTIILHRNFLCTRKQGRLFCRCRNHEPVSKLGSLFTTPGAGYLTRGATTRYARILVQSNLQNVRSHHQSMYVHRFAADGRHTWATRRNRQKYKKSVKTKEEEASERPGTGQWADKKHRRLWETTSNSKKNGVRGNTWNDNDNDNDSDNVDRYKRPGATVQRVNSPIRASSFIAHRISCRISSSSHLGHITTRS